MSITLFLLLALQTPMQAQGVTLYCEAGAARHFSVFVPAQPMVEARPDNVVGHYRVTGLSETETPDTAIGSLDASLSIIWQPDDGGETLLDIMRYNATSGTARFRIRRENNSANGIVSITSSDGTCARRQPHRSSTGTQSE